MNRSSSPSGTDGNDIYWQKILAALGDEKWDFRSVDGLAKQTGLSADVVKGLLEKHPKEVRKSFVPDSTGRVLYTLANKPMELREILASARAFVSKST